MNPWQQFMAQARSRYAEPVPLEAALAQLLGTQRFLKHN